jgi:uncharacterized membrane protein YjjP (DUF1212 family)
MMDIISSKPPLTHEELTDVIKLALWAGQLLLQHGAETQQVEETVHRLTTGLGCAWADILVSPNAIVMTAISGVEFRTKVRRVVSLGVNMTIVTEVSDLSRRVDDGELDRFTLRSELRRISDAPGNYNRWPVMFMVGLACASFSRLFGGDWPVFVVTLLASCAAMVVRQELQRRYFNAFLVAIVTAFVAGLVASLAPRLQLGSQPQLALASSVLLLVPGVPLINAVEDLIKGHIVTGIVRGITGGLVAMCIALGLLLAMAITGGSGL